MHIFISYKAEDRPVVAELVNAMRTDGLSVWWDQDIPPAAPWEASIEQALASASCVIVCWTQRSVDPNIGAKVQVEAREALERDTLLQVMLEPVSPPLFFRQYQAIDLHNWKGDRKQARFVALAKAARQILAGAPPESITLATPRGRTRQVRRVLISLLGVAIVAAVIGGTILFPAQTRQAVCRLPQLSKICAGTPYDVAQLTPAKRQLVREVRAAVEIANQSGARARDAEKLGEAGAAAAHTNQAETMVIEQPGFHYAGGWANDLPNGFGEMSWSAGSASVGERYVGQFKDEVRALGVFIYPPGAANTSNVSRYEGDWAPEPGYSKGNWNGHGIVRLRDGSVYEGQVKHGAYDGLGALTKTNGARIEGRWARGAPLESEIVEWDAKGVFIPPDSKR